MKLLTFHGPKHAKRDQGFTHNDTLPSSKQARRRRWMVLNLMYHGHLLVKLPRVEDS